MWGEKQYKKRRSSREESPDYSKENRLTASKAFGLMALVAILFLFQIGLLIFNKCIRKEPPGSESKRDYGRDYSNSPIYSAKRYSSKIRQKGSWSKREGKTSLLFYFNPNTIPSDSLVMLGLSEKQAASIIKYRVKGGKFRKKEDFAKMYTVSPDFYRHIENYIRIPHVIEYPDTIRARTTIAPAVNIKNHNGDTTLRKEKKENCEKKAVAPKIIDLNLADSTQLISLYGIGPYFAKKIMEYRKRIGSFAYIEQLLEINGIDNERIEGFRNRVTIADEHIMHFSLDTISVAFMKRNPYIGSYAAQGIVLLRESLSKKALKPNEAHITPQLLLKERILPAEQERKLMLYCN